MTYDVIDLRGTVIATGLSLQEALELAQTGANIIPVGEDGTVYAY